MLWFDVVNNYFNNIAFGFGVKVRAQKECLQETDYSLKCDCLYDGL